MTFRSRILSTLCLTLALGAGFGMSSAMADSAATAPQQPKDALPLKELQAFSEIFQRIKQDYVKPVSDKELLDNAIQGMLSGLDPHSAYLDANAFKQLQIDTTGEFGGLGIVVGTKDGFIQVISPIDDTPAQRAGIKPGDIITRINGESVQGIGLDKAVKMMRGKPGTEVKLEVVREGENKPLNFTLKREVIRVDSVKSRMLEPGYGYVRITSFQANTPASLKKAIDQLDRDNKGPLKGLVLDLRNNPGGVLNAAVGVSDTFLNKGLIVYTKGRMPGSDLRYDATPGDILHGAPMVVLVNGGTASAAEIVSGALKDNHRALIVGTRTFGKGSVQTVLPLSRDTAVKLTTALYFTPNGHSIQAEGIEPNIVVEPLAVGKSLTEGFKALREADLSGHLANPDGKVQPRANGKGDPGLARSDFQLYEALTVLKSLVLSAGFHGRSAG
ncbi:peptidase S41 [Acidihalobacter aeolianus]|uniref:Peptidase S41 n=1 Tax=Acidihalobacter aeolianus TaxID=2792603 RepID=A0A1D8K4G8_9GAMM|nr:S41 family peptidase [Acidihalobacter aeolianus]AOV15855.1 peptidase S41 [Acidihalobacter aeolianus]